MNANLQKLFQAKILASPGATYEQKVNEAAVLIGTGAAFQGLLVFCILVVIFLMIFIRALNYHRGNSPWDSASKRR
ncbi:hypothetical protein HOP50_10g60460 [Chloropicon primus]|uniref:Uncharacterized protein n=1 Tax=Chloropicon primus TaxID=1764295 RepID=A0A5B8MT62_9CHLO|nr:hypothetical protein A3770_10p60250 [Chloropicon primus]UPR02719.1 hypothetical protein HOP50_10g60460 [Chloropicon primus]|eukprot:QDZ23507.1 hypothetical protein A3770_10p60250 [Chloropicon primus]